MAKSGNRAEPKRWFIILLIVIVLSTAVSLLERLGEDKNSAPLPEETIYLSQAGESSSAELEKDLLLLEGERQSSELIPVYITGQVKMPGVYRVKEGQILDDLVKMAGGLAKEAAPEAVNLAAQLKAHQLYRIPAEDELEENPALYLDGSASQEEFNQKININQADQQELESLPGVGPATAQAILKYREQHGPFQMIEDIMLIPGIKKAKFQSLEDLITAD